MAELKVEMRSYFTTPVFLVDLLDAQSLNEALKAVILEREATQPSTAHSNLGGWQSSWDFDRWGGSAAKKVLDVARQLATKVTATRTGQPTRPPWKLNAWANVNRSGHGNEFHTHPGAFWSGTYYVDDGGIGFNPELGGAFEMQDPRGIAPAMYAPQFAFAIPGGQSVGAAELLLPRSGLMVLFPSWLQHAVRPYHGHHARISIAFNLSL